MERTVAGPDYSLTTLPKPSPPPRSRRVHLRTQAGGPTDTTVPAEPHAQPFRGPSAALTAAPAPLRQQLP
jgi:hypothetical protein